MQSVTELYTKWDLGIEKLVKKFGVRPHDVEDVKQEIYLDFLKGHVFGHCPVCKQIVRGKPEGDTYYCTAKVGPVEEQGFCRAILEGTRRISYAEIFSEEKSSETTFVYNFVWRRCMQWRSKESRQLTTKCVSFFDEDGSDILDLVQAPVENVPQKLDFVEAFARLKEKLSGIPVGRLSEALCLENSLAKVFVCLERGMNRTGIARELKRSNSTVTLLMAKIALISEELGMRKLDDDMF